MDGFTLKIAVIMSTCDPHTDWGC